MFEVRNPGETELTDLVIQVQMTDELNHDDGRFLQHRIASLSPGQVYRTRLTTTAVEDGIARFQSTLTAGSDLQSTAAASVEVRERATDPAANRWRPSAGYRIMCGP